MLGEQGATSSPTPRRSTRASARCTATSPRSPSGSTRASRVAEGRLDGAISHCGLIRYDAYNEMSGRQSTSIALLDSARTGVVLSSIHHRDQARLYAKQISEGKGELQLSPEEEEALRIALAS